MKRMCFFSLLFLFLFPIYGFALDYIPNGESGILIEAGSGKIIFEKDKDKQLSVASMTKMVAQIIIMEEIEKGSIHWDDVVIISHNASSMGGSQIYLEEGEKITVRDLMKGISVASGNDATVAMAEYISGSEEKFVERMNQVVKTLGLKNTHFVNSTGLDEDNHYSSSYDMAMIARELVLHHPGVLEFSSIYEDYLRENTDHKFWLVNTNKLIHFYDGADGLKTGHTDNAGYCLAATAKRGSLRLIAIVLGEKDSKVRNRETINLLDYGFQSVQMNCLMKKDHVVDSLKMDMANKDEVDILLKNDLCVVEEKGKKEDYQYNIVLNQNKFPIQKGDVVGRIEVILNDKVINQEELTVREPLKKKTLLKFYVQNLFNFISGIL